MHRLILPLVVSWQRRCFGLRFLEGFWDLTLRNTVKYLRDRRDGVAMVARMQACLSSSLSLGLFISMVRCEIFTVDLWYILYDPPRYSMPQSGGDGRDGLSGSYSRTPTSSLVVSRPLSGCKCPGSRGTHHITSRLLPSGLASLENLRWRWRWRTDRAACFITNLPISWWSGVYEHEYELDGNSLGCEMVSCPLDTCAVHSGRATMMGWTSHCVC